MSTPASEILQSGEAFRRRLLDRDAAAELRLWRQYTALSETLRAQQAALAADIAARGIAGPSQLMLDRRYRVLLGEASDVIAGLSERMGQMVPEYARDAVLDGMRAVSEVSGPSFARLDRGTVERMTGAATGGPLDRLLATFNTRTNADVAAFFRNTLITGAAMGTGADVLARRLVEGTEGLVFTRARTIVRTEINRAHREATRTAIQNNPLVAGWVWRSAADERACAACLSLHGEFFPGSTPMSAHPNCRCVMVPTRTAADDPLGFSRGTAADSIVSLEGRFRGLDRGMQDQWLGHTRAELLRSGKIDWADLRTLRRNPIWGDSYQVTPIHALTGLPPAAAA